MSILPLFNDPAPTKSTLLSLNPKSPVLSVYPSMNSDDKKTIDDFLICLKIGIAFLVIFGSMLLANIRMFGFPFRKDLNDGTRPFFAGFAFVCIIAIILICIATNYNDHPVDIVNNIVKKYQTSKQ